MARGQGAPVGRALAASPQVEAILLASPVPS